MSYDVMRYSLDTFLGQLLLRKGQLLEPTTDDEVLYPDKMCSTLSGFVPVNTPLYHYDLNVSKGF